MRHRHSLKTITAAAVTVAVFALSACGGDDSEPKAQEPVTVTASPEETSAAPEAEDTASVTESTVPSTDAEPANQAKFGPYTAPSVPGVSVVDSGFSGRESTMNPYVSYGVVLYNNGPATSVEVTAQGIHNDQVIESSKESFLYVPADTFFAMGGTLVEMKSPSDTVEFTVTTSASTSRELDVAIDAEASISGGSGAYGAVSLNLTNAGRDTLPEAAVHVVLLNGAGKIVGGGNDFLSVPVQGGGQKVRDAVEDVFIPNGAKTALAYVDLLYAL